MDEEKDEFDSLRDLNGLVYDRPAIAALISRRQVKINNFTAQQFSLGDTAICVNNVQDCVYGPTSMLKLEIVVNNIVEVPAKGLFGVNGSILNIIESVRVTHRSGEQTSYLQQAGVWATIQRFYAVNGAGADQLDGLLNVVETDKVFAAVAGPVGNLTTIICMVPLWLFLGEFNNHNQVIPAALIAGMRMEWKFQSRESTVASANVIGISIRPSLLLDCVAPYDSVEKSLLMEQADATKSGLQYTYYSPFQTSTTVNTSDINFDIQQASTICQSAHAVLRLASSLNDDTKSKMLFECALSKVQWRLASIYYPNQQIVVPSASVAANSTEPYWTTLTAWNGLPNQQDVKLAGQGANVKYSDFSSVAAGRAVYSQTLDRSPVSSCPYSGQSTNNSRLLVLIGGLPSAPAPANALRCDVFAVSLRVINLFADSAVVDR